MPRQTFRSTFTRILCGILWVLIAVVAIGLLAVHAAAVSPALVIVGALGCAALVYGILWSPSITVDDDGVRVDNIALAYDVPWAALIHVDTRYALQLHTPGRRIGVTAAPAPGATGSLRAARAHRRSEGTTAPGTRPGELPTTDSGRAAALVRDRWYALRDAGRVEAGIAETVPVGVRPRVDNLLLLAAGAVGVVLAIVLG
ncbi:PH domain-containing protein [Microbacterium sp. IEGM 1404]|uniref:PH domain-containing protein n=1 Tax=Microbacterium sp. IEGM 1404 TaxID=3047084 RepID=UPI0024B713B5|nr:PH domain-containing protein [Microbacterium sp. IEGM 1404]MDI9890029.1 PH domain-containing protein [Microbacterium sp. IEGM 1404]